MRFSIFTPTNDTTHLAEAYASLLAQTFTDWQWLIVPNGGANVDNLIDDDDDRVRVERSPPFLGGGVGALKAYACAQCEGEYLVELDHDDMLLPHALERIDEAITASGADFLYSDCARFRADGSCELFDKVYGWEHQTLTHHEQLFDFNRSFPVNARSLAAIHFAPDHVRVWRRSFYKVLGGHDPALTVCDDYDLVIRTYLAGADVAYIPMCLYLYRLRTDGGNTWLKRNAEIQQKQQELSNRHLESLIEEWCERESLPITTIGATSALLQWFREAPESSVGCLRAHNVLQRVPHCQPSCTHQGTGCVVELMNGIHRVLVPGGWLLSSTPSTDGRGAWQDPTHCSGWNPNSFWYYTKGQLQQFVGGITARFQAVRVWQDFPSEWHRDNNIPYVHAHLCALKGQRQPGIVEFQP